MLLAHLPLAWIVARAAGMVAFALLTLSTWLGLAMSTRILGTRRQKALLGWHRTLVWTGLSMLVLHAGALLVDPVLRFGLSSVLVPFASPWHAGAVAMGVIAGWFSLMLALSFRARRWIGQRGWRLLHYTSFAAFGLALMHALYAGTDFVGVKGPIIATAALAPVLWLGFLRMLEPSRSPARPTAGFAARRGGAHRRRPIRTFDGPLRRRITGVKRGFECRRSRLLTICDELSHPPRRLSVRGAYLPH